MIHKLSSVRTISNVPRTFILGIHEFIFGFAPENALLLALSSRCQSHEHNEIAIYIAFNKNDYQTSLGFYRMGGYMTDFYQVDHITYAIPGVCKIMSYTSGTNISP